MPHNPLSLRQPDPADPSLDDVQRPPALERLRPALAALDPNKLHPLNVEIAVAATTVLGCVPKINALRAVIAAACNDVDLSAIDQLADRAYALLDADAAYGHSRTIDPRFRRGIIQEATEARQILHTVALGYIETGHIPRDALRSLHARRGHLDIATDLTALTTAFVDAWDKIGGQIPFTREKLSRAQGVAEQLMKIVGLEDVAPERPAEATQLRLRAWTLLDIAYDEARRAVTHVRWKHGDADEIAPSLRAHRGRKKTKQKEPVAGGTG